jgi:tetraacyldisaccharide 4'-kinase
MILSPKDIEASWYGRVRLGALQCGLLTVLSWLYAVVTAIRRRFYGWGFLSKTRLPVPVVVVGNLIVGGAGKTPLTRALAGQLRDAGWRPGIISRGYGRQAPGVRAVGIGDSPRHVGDEPLLYAADGFPVVVGEKRVDAARTLLAANPSVDVLIADDGLQHYALDRDIEIVVFDRRGFGNGRLLPAGPLREGPARLCDPRVKALVWQGGLIRAPECPGTDVPSYAMTLATSEVYAINDRDRRQSLASFAGQTVHAVAGIGHPERFFQMLRDQGIRVHELPFPDHHDFQRTDIPISSVAVLMTEKDAVKCHEFSAGRDNWFVVPVIAQVAPTLPLDEWLKRAAGAHDGAC